MATVVNRVSSVRAAAAIASGLGIAFVGGMGRAHAQAVIAPTFTGSYSIADLGSAPAAVVPRYGGLTLKAGDANTLLLGANANTTSAVINTVGLTRTTVNGKNRITGFTGTTGTLSTAASPGGGIDGGLAYGPNNVLFYTSYSDNYLGEIKSGSTAPDKLINLSQTTPAIDSSVGGVQFVPAGLPNAGKIWISSYNNSSLFEASVVADGSGTYNLSGVTALGTFGSGPEGIVFVPSGSALFPTASVLVTNYSGGTVTAYPLDASGHPVIASARTFITGLNGAEGGTIDSTTGDFLFSTFGGNDEVYAVRGFATAGAAPEPGALALLAVGVPGMVGLIRRRRK